MSSILVIHFLGNESLNVCPKIFVSPSKNDDRKEKVKKEKKKKTIAKLFTLYANVISSDSSEQNHFAMISHETFNMNQNFQSYVNTCVKKSDIIYKFSYYIVPCTK